ncbi:MAG: hypothetical protein ACREFZ_10555 [Acetobacteraceae bacterium]
MENTPETNEAPRDSIPVLTERASGASDTVAESDLTALTERVLDEIAPALRAAIAAACEDYIAAHEARHD